MTRETREPVWTHKGLFLGIVPIFLADTFSDEPMLAGRGFVSDIMLDIVEALFGIFCILMSAVDPEFEAMFPIKITGEISP